MNKKVLILVFILFFASLSFAKSVELIKAENNYFIQSDGLVKVEENFWARFSGEFTEGFRILDFSKGEELLNVKAFVNEEEVPVRLIEISASRKEIDYELFPYKKNPSKTHVKLLFEVKKAVKAFNDVGEFELDVWGNQWDLMLPDLNGKIVLPKTVSNAKEIYSWGRPTLQGKIGLAKDNQSLVFETFNVPARQAVKITMAFPRELLDSTENAIEIQENGLQKIIEREEFSTKVDPFLASIITALIVLVNLLLVLIIPISFIVLWFHSGKEPQVEYNAIYERDIPFNYSPAIVSSLINIESKKPSEKAVIAVILDLCLKGFFKLRKIEKEKFLGLIGGGTDFEILFEEKTQNKKLDELTEQEKTVFKWITIHHEDKTSFSELEKEIKNDGNFSNKFLDWQKQVEKEMQKMKFFKSTFAEYAFPIIAAITIITSFVFIWILNDMLFFIIFAVVFIEGFIGFAVYKKALTARTKEGTLHYFKWMKLKAFLNDFSQLKTMPADAIILWEKFLVYAIVLGCADKVQEAMQVVFATQNQIHSNIFVGSIGYSSFRNLTNFAPTFSSTIASSTSTSGSSGFSGGGSYGGGGSFGGGGGFR